MLTTSLSIWKHTSIRYKWTIITQMNLRHKKVHCKHWRKEAWLHKTLGVIKTNNKTKLKLNIMVLTIVQHKKEKSNFTHRKRNLSFRQEVVRLEIVQLIRFNRIFKTNQHLVSEKVRFKYSIQQGTQTLKSQTVPELLDTKAVRDFTITLIIKSAQQDQTKFW